MKKILKGWIWYLVGAVIGVIGGYFYWKFIGCNSGTCMITSKPLNSMLYFGLMGALVVGMFKPVKKEA